MHIRTSRHTKSGWIAVVAACFSLGLGGCGGGTESTPLVSGPPPANLIGPAGGEVKSGDLRATLTIPQNAVGSPTQFTIDVAQGSFPSGTVGTVYEINPSGTLFQPNPATLTITYDPALPAGTDPAQLSIGTLDSGTWVTVAGSSVDTTKQTVTVSLTHLSPYAIVLPGTPPTPNQPPIASIGGPYQGQVGQRVSFSAVGSMDPDDDPLTFTWNFGDSSGSISIPTPTTTHSYASVGSFPVTLTVADGHGGSDTATTFATIQLPPVNQSPTAISETFPIEMRVSEISVHLRSYAITLKGSGTGPLTFRVTQLPGHAGDPTMAVTSGTFYQRWSEALPTTLKWETFQADTSTSVAPITGLVTGPTPTVLYVPNLCTVDTFVSDSFTFTVTDASGMTSVPATITLNISDPGTLCKSENH